MTASKSPLHSNLLWAAGHGTFLLCALLYVLTSVTLFYKLGMLGLCAGLVIELYRVVVSTADNASLAEKLVLSESTPYLFLSVLLYIFPFSTVLLLPLAIHSLYNVVFAARAQPMVLQTAVWKQYGHLTDQLLSVHAAALDAGTQIELLALPWLLVSIWSTGFILPVVYASFLRWQYFVQPRMRLAVASWDSMFGKAVEHPSCPKQVRKFYNSFQSMIKKWAKVNHVNAASMRASGSAGSVGGRK